MPNCRIWLEDVAFYDPKADSNELGTWWLWQNDGVRICLVKIEFQKSSTPLADQLGQHWAKNEYVTDPRTGQNSSAQSVRQNARADGSFDSYLEPGGKAENMS